MPPTSDPYQLLGVTPVAGTQEVRRAFRRLALKHHPDHNPSDPSAVHRFRIVVEAYQRITRHSERARAARHVALDPVSESWLDPPQEARRYRGGPVNLPVRWKRAACGFAVAHGKSIPIVASMILSALITAVGLLSEARAAGRLARPSPPVPMAQVSSLLK